MALRGAYAATNSKPTMDSILGLCQMLRRPQNEIVHWFQTYKSQQDATFITSALSAHAPPQTTGPSGASKLVFDTSACVAHHPDSANDANDVYVSVGIPSVGATPDVCAPPGASSQLASQTVNPVNPVNPVNVSMAMVQHDFTRDTHMDLDKTRVSPSSSNSHAHAFSADRGITMPGNNMLGHTHPDMQSHQQQDVRLGSGGMDDAIRKSEPSMPSDTDVRINDAMQPVHGGVGSLYSAQQQPGPGSTGPGSMQAQGLYGANYMYGGDNGMTFGASVSAGVTPVTAGVLAASGSGSSTATLAPLRYSAGGAAAAAAAAAAMGHGHLQQSGGVWYPAQSGGTVFPK